MRAAILTLALSAALANAAVAKPVTAGEAAQFKVGVATLAEVEAKLGKPMVTTMNSDGTESITYASAKYRVKAATFIPIVGIFAGGSTVTSSALTFVFDANGVLKNSTASSSNINCGSLAAGAGCNQ